MARLQQIRQSLLESLSGSPVALVCARIIDYASLQKAENLRMLTYKSLARAAELDPSDPVFAMALSRLSGGDANALFVKHYLLRDFDGEARAVDDEIVRDAFVSRELVLSDGTVVHDVDEHLIPYFAASHLLLKAKASVTWR